MLTCRDPCSSLDSQDFRYNAGDGRLGAEIETLSEVSFSWALVSFASSVTFDLSLEDLIQGLGDTSWVLVEGWEGGASGRVKSQLPSLGLGHVWGTTYIPISLWKQVVGSLSMTCMISDPDLFHPFSCPTFHETSLSVFFFFLFEHYVFIAEKAMTPNSSTLAWKSNEQRSLDACSAWDSWGPDTTEQLHFHFSLSCIGEGNGNPLHCSFFFLI